MTTETAPSDIQVTRPSRWQAIFTQETIVTSVASLVVGIAVILPLLALILNSFLVLDDLGFDTEWGLAKAIY